MTITSERKPYHSGRQAGERGGMNDLAGAFAPVFLTVMCYN